MKLGDRVIIKARMRRPSKEWIREELPKPIEGLFIGYRTKTQGQTERWQEYDGDYGGSGYTVREWVVNSRFKTMLVVVNTRENPYVVLLDDYEVAPPPAQLALI